MSDTYDIIAEGMARALWCDAWANWADEQHQKNPKVRYYPPGCELMDHMPAVPQRAYNEAWRLFGAIEELNGGTMAVLCHRAWLADNSPGKDSEECNWTNAGQDYWKEFGHYLAMEALGHGVSWADDHEAIEIKFPKYTYVDFYDEFEALEK